MRAVKSDDIHSIDRKKTKEKVENKLRIYNDCLYGLHESKLPKVTASYTIITSGSSGNTSSTETVALSNIQKVNDDTKLVDSVSRAINRLSQLERKVIVECYMNSEHMFDYQIFTKLHLSRTQFYRIKSSAIYKLALTLRLAVYEV